MLRHLRPAVRVGHRRTRSMLVLLTAAGCLVGGESSQLRAADLQSPALAKQVMQLLAAAKLDAIAAKDPATTDRFVAALAFPDQQLLVIAGRYSAPALLDQDLSTSAYRDVYAALQGSAIRDSALFVQDLGADGLNQTSSQSVDIVYEQVTNQTVLDGSSSKKSKLTKIDGQYSQMLQVLIGRLQNPAASTSTTSLRTP